MATLTVRNIPDDAKLRFRQAAAAQGRSMEEHLRQLVIEAGGGKGDINRVREKQPATMDDNWVHRLMRIADGAGEGVFDKGKYAEIRFMTAKDAMAELRRLANGVGLDLPGKMNTKLEAPEF